MDNEALESCTRLSSSIVKENPKKSLDALFVLIRKYFVFDNLAIYLVEGRKDTLEVVYARAAGRGRSKEADASWGEEIASKVISTGKAAESKTTNTGDDDRVALPYFLGLPLSLQNRSGALV